MHDSLMGGRCPKMVQRSARSCKDLASLADMPSFL